VFERFKTFVTFAVPVVVIPVIKAFAELKMPELLAWTTEAIFAEVVA